MSVTSATSSTNPAKTLYETINTKESAASTSKMTDQQNRFLMLLTTQLKNQDPLNPLDNAQVTSQMAQINTVDGIERLNLTLKNLLDNYGTTQTLQAASLVGQHVLVPGGELALAGGGAAGGFSLGSSADKVTVTIKDANGLVVRNLEFGSTTAGVHTFTWDGLSDSGAAAVDGNYQIAVRAKQGTNDVEATKLQLGLVGSVTSNAGSALLNVGKLGSFGMKDVYQIL
jgi:flagellar basal-body rod modification protein FlgD